VLVEAYLDNNATEETEREEITDSRTPCEY